MKKEELFNIIGEVDEQKVAAAGMAMNTKKKSRPVWVKWGAMAACLVLVVAATVSLPMLSDNENTTPITEYQYESGYFYSIDSGVFSTYVGGKVIAEDKIGNKIEDITATAGWKNGAGEWTTNESLRGEVYLIDGISSDVAVALKFLDKGEAVTTTHYYVILNPNADLSAVEEYVIAPVVPNNMSDEMAGEVYE